MSDPSYTGTNETTGALPAVPPVLGALGDFAKAHYQSESTQASPEVDHKVYNGNGSGESRVDINYFDPTGVDQLKRTLSKQWQDERPTSHAKSSETGTSEDTFDFEKVLRGVMQRFARPLPYSNASC